MKTIGLIKTRYIQRFDVREGQSIGRGKKTPHLSILWNFSSVCAKTPYIERATKALRESGKLPDDGMLQYLSPLGWEHINLTGDYVWRQNRMVDDGQFRPLRNHLKDE